MVVVVVVVTAAVVVVFEMLLLSFPFLFLRHCKVVCVALSCCQGCQISRGSKRDPFSDYIVIRGQDAIERTLLNGCH